MPLNACEKQVAYYVVQNNMLCSEADLSTNILKNLHLWSKKFQTISRKT